MAASGKLFLWTWLAGMAGVAALGVNLAASLGATPLPAPLPVIVAASVVQGALLLALACWAGARWAPAAGLRAPAFEALAGGGDWRAALAPQWLPGLAGGVAGALLLVLLQALSPFPPEAQLAGAQPLAVRMLYGGITEELLVRFGLMSAVAVLLLRLWRRPQGAARQRLLYAAVCVSALAFAAGHLPYAASLVPSLTPAVLLYVLAGNALFGIIAGMLFLRRGLESAIIAHMLAHAGAALVQAA